MVNLIQENQHFSHVPGSTIYFLSIVQHESLTETDLFVYLCIRKAYYMSTLDTSQSVNSFFISHFFSSARKLTGQIHFIVCKVSVFLPNYTTICEEEATKVLKLSSRENPRRFSKEPKRLPVDVIFVL